MSNQSMEITVEVRKRWWVNPMAYIFYIAGCLLFGREYFGLELLYRDKKPKNNCLRMSVYGVKIKRIR